MAGSCNALSPVPHGPAVGTCRVALTLVLLLHTSIAAAAAAASRGTLMGIPPPAATIRSALSPASWAFRPMATDTPATAGSTVEFPFGSLTLGSAAEFPALSSATGVDLSYILVRIHAGAVAPAHVHPRAAELAFVLSGTVEVTWVDEYGTPVAPPRSQSSRRPSADLAAGGRRVANSLRRHEAAVVPRALPHSVACVSAGGCVVLAVLNAGDPGTAFLASSICAMGGAHPGGALGNLTAPAVEALCTGGVV
ncbi:hypothetical protein MMPV_001050 [Pyropia vietnamensis]